jgi:DNA-binding LacI/PurR family transcriptional regulator
MAFDLKHPYCTKILSGIERSFHRAGYVPILTDIWNNRIISGRSVERLMERQIEGLVTLVNSLYLETELDTIVRVWNTNTGANL